MGFVPSQMLGYGNGGDHVYAWANDGEFMKDDRTAWMDNPKLVETLQWQADVIERRAAWIRRWSTAPRPTIAGFALRGRHSAMMVSGDWVLMDISKYYEGMNFGTRAVAHARQRYGRDRPWRRLLLNTCRRAPNSGRDLAFLDVLASRDRAGAPGRAVLGQSIRAPKEAALSDEVVDELALSGAAAHGERVDGNMRELPPDYAGRPS